jgi:hypothetical protein
MEVADFGISGIEPLNSTTGGTSGREELNGEGKTLHDEELRGSVHVF